MKKILILVVSFLLLSVGGIYAYFKLSVEPSSKISEAKNQLQMKGFLTESLKDSVHKYLAKTMRDRGQVAMAVIQDGQVSYYGVLRKDNALVQLENQDSLFQIGSISKVFTSSILANQIINGRAKLDDNVDTYFGFPFHNNLKLSLVSLSNHTSGLDRMPSDVYLQMAKNFEDPYVNYTESWLTHYLKESIAVDKDKIGKSNYSNLGASILGNALARNSNKSLGQLFQDEIFSKYNMSHTYIPDSNRLGKIISAYDVEGQPSVIWNLNAFNPAGGIISNVKDMAKFALACLDSSNQAQVLMRNKTIGIDSNTYVGLAWHIMKTKKGHTWLWHNGATGSLAGYTSSMTIDVTNHRAVILLSNVHITDLDFNLDRLGYSILNYLNGNKTKRY